MNLELRGRCPFCHNERIVWGYIINNPTPETMDALEVRADMIGGVEAHCKKCDRIEDVAFFVDGKQTEEWMNAVEYERRNGPGGGPLPPKPWRNPNNEEET